MPVRRKDQAEPDLYCRDCWEFFVEVLSAIDLEREERAKRMIEGATGGEGGGRE